MTDPKKPGKRGGGGSGARSGSASAGGATGSLRGSPKGAPKGTRSRPASGSSDRPRGSPKGRPGSSGATSATGRQSQKPGQGRGRRPDEAERVQPTVAQPPVLVSFARGLGAVGSSPQILVTTFASVLALWLAFTAYGAGLVASSGAIVQFMELPPARTYIDLGFLQLGRLSVAGAIAFGISLIVFRSFVTAFLIASIDLTLREPMTWRERLGASLRRARGSFWTVLALEVGFVAATLFVGSLTVLAGSQAAGLVYFAWLIGGVYFFVYCEIAAVVDRAPVRQAVILGIRAARLPGREHAILVFSYEIVALILSSFIAGRGIVTATPGVAVWGYALFIAFLHVSVLAAFTWRWEILAEPVKAGAGARGTRPPGGSLFGLGGPRR